MRKPRFLLTLTMTVIALASFAGAIDEDSWLSINDKYRKQFYAKQYFDAEETAPKVLEKAKEEYGCDSFCVAFSLNNLSMLRRKQGDRQESDRYFSEALEMTKELIGTRDQKIEGALKNARGGTGYRFGANDPFSDFNLNTLPWIKLGTGPSDRTTPDERLDKFLGEFLTVYLQLNQK